MFKKEKYKNCIKHLVHMKNTIIVFYTLIFVVIGAVIGLSMVGQTINMDISSSSVLMDEEIMGITDNETGTSKKHDAEYYKKILIASAIIGGIIGGFAGYKLGVYMAWRIEMKIQECYWRIDVLDELKDQNPNYNRVTITTNTSKPPVQKIESENNEEEKNDNSSDKDKEDEEN